MNGSPTPSQAKAPSVAIIGGGVCGLVCAVSLMKKGVDVQLYEASVRPNHFILCSLLMYFATIPSPIQSKFGEVGAGVGLGTF